MKPAPKTQHFWNNAILLQFYYIKKFDNIAFSFNIFRFFILFTFSELHSVSFYQN